MFSGSVFIPLKAAIELPIYRPLKGSRYVISYERVCLCCSALRCLEATRARAVEAEEQSVGREKLGRRLVVNGSLQRDQ